MSSMPEVGSKISLISKADIRYEGRLFTVDPQECTIALANVRSFGTEDRETPYPIPPQSTVYDYILFRGSDIKDIRVINNVAIPNDPAIMQMHLPPQQNFAQNFSPMQHSNSSQSSFGPFGHMPGMNAPMGQNLPPQQQPQQSQSPTTRQQDSRSGTPQNVSRKSPASEVGAQAQRENQAAKEKGPRNNQNNQRNNRRDSPRNDMQENKGGFKNQNQRSNNHQNQNKQQQQQHPQQQQQQRGGYRNNNQGQQQGGRMIQGMNMNNNNRGMRNNFNKPQNMGMQNNKPNGVHRGNNKNTLKFENEFDFEQANSKFEELRSQLSKLKVGTDEVVKPTEQVDSEQANGDVDKKEDSGNETGADHENDGCDDATCYDKKKSFFDNISCEAVERSKGKMQRTDWRQERKINSETFGFSSNRRGNYRGRPQNNRGPRQNNYHRYNNYNQNYRPRNNRIQTLAGQNSSGNNNNQASTTQKPAATTAANK